MTSPEILSALDAGFKRITAKGITPFPHQVEGATKQATEMRFVNADEPGLGKTLQATMAADAIHTATGASVIVLAPKTVLENWRIEMDNLAPAMSAHATVHTWASIPEPPDASFTLIADEAHLGKAGYGTKRGDAFLNLALHERCIACFPLTGSPTPNGRSVEFWPLLAAIRAPHAQDYDLYRSVFDDNPMRLFILNLPYVLRRGRFDCPGMPPPPIRTVHEVTLSEAQTSEYFRVYNKLRDSYFNRVTYRIISDEAWALAQLTHLFHAASNAKADYAVQMAEGILSEGRPVVIFAEFIDTVKAIAGKLARHGVEVLLGQTGGRHRQEAKERFQRGDSRVFVMNATGGLAITLTRAHDLIMVDRLWTPEYNNQIERRIDRITQTHICHMYWISLGKLDYLKDNVNFEKLEEINQMVTGTRATLERVARPSAAMMLQEVIKS